jgi:hypothetical protein
VSAQAYQKSKSDGRWRVVADQAGTGLGGWRGEDAISVYQILFFVSKQRLPPPKKVTSPMELELIHEDDLEEILEEVRRASVDRRVFARQRHFTGNPRTG